MNAHPVFIFSMGFNARYCCELILFYIENNKKYVAQIV